MFRRKPIAGYSRGVAEWRLLPVMVAVLVSGCAALPDSGSRLEMQSAAAMASEQTFSSDSGSWPARQWWQVYRDPQLDSLMVEALRSAPDLMLAQARMREAASLLGLADAALAPDISLNASLSEEKMSYNTFIPGDFLPQGWNSYGRLALDMRWELDFWGKNRAELAAATSELTAREAELAQARLSLTAALASAYADLNRLYLNRDTAERSLQVRSKTVELFTKRQQFGMENNATVREAEARLAVAEGKLLALNEQIALQQNHIAALLGQGPDRGLTISRPHISLLPAQTVPDQLALNLLGRRPDIVAARFRVEQQEHLLESRQAAFYPNINLTAFVGYQSLDVANLFDQGSDIGGIAPAVSLPLFNGGRLRADLRRSEAAYDRQVAAYNQTISHAMREVADVIVSSRALSARIAKAEQAVAAASQAHQVFSRRYAGGLSSNLQVLSAEDALLISQEALTNLQARALQLNVALNKALGGGYQSGSAAQPASNTQDAPVRELHHL